MTIKGRGRRRTARKAGHLKMSIYGFALDSIAQMPVVLLKSDDEVNSLPIWLNSTDTLYIVAELIRHDAAAKSDRKDLLAALLAHLGTEVTAIVIDDVKDGLVTASANLILGGEPVKLEIRAAEALVLALKHSLPVLVADHLLDNAPFPDGVDQRFTDADERRFVDFLDNLDPAALGKYPM